MMRRNGMRAVLGAAGLLAVLGAGACGGGEQREAGRVAAESSGCAALQQRITAGQAVDVAAAEVCDQTQFARLENQRQAARAKGEKPAMQVSAICRAVDAQAAKGDAKLNFGLAFHCRQRERFANTVNATSGLGPANKVTSLCLGARAKKARGEAVDAFTDSFCGKEEAAAGGSSAAPEPSSPAAPAQSTAPAAPAAPAASAPPAASGGGDVVCPGSTVTLSGEAGAPAASSDRLPAGTKVKVTNLDNGKSTTVAVTSASGSCVLLNNAAFEQVREAGKFLIRHARIERVG
ncbi:septal ring lytic transglycosylase RlpA family protein [Actinomadura montaniterrae]|uniref:septal ring lytic transglycosylase RlpA family protein n=1 Tax=Actinomadura montaniterrae TaxID=1803903 RepID=UPI001CEF71F6|nr:septal ring lytic transglycosylase RlpA family protein [Actinomadura montaniterrae]